jgi:hypothetical protein
MSFLEWWFGLAREVCRAKGPNRVETQDGRKRKTVKMQIRIRQATAAPPRPYKRTMVVWIKFEK